MKTITIIAALFLVTAGAAKTVDSDFSEILLMLGHAYLKCFIKYGFKSFVPDTANGLAVTSETQACFTQCMMVNLELAKTDQKGDLIPFEVFEFLGLVIPKELPKSAATVNYCVVRASTDSNVCGKSMNAFQCILKGFTIIGFDELSQILASSKQ